MSEGEKQLFFESRALHYASRIYFFQEIDQQKKRYTGTPPFGAMITFHFGTTKSFSLF